VILIPAIDLKDGQCVRLFKGRFEEKTVYGSDPAAMAERWAEAGAGLVHLVDLDGSLGDNAANHKAIREIRRRVKAALQLGGGLKTMDSLAAWVDSGVDRLILGTAVCENPGLVEAAAARWPGRVAAALDASGRTLKTWGWRRESGLDLLDVARTLGPLGASLVIHTDVDRDGTRLGPNLAMAARVAEASGLPTVVSGGVANLADLEAARDAANPLFFGVVSGKALYEGTLDFAAGAAVLAGPGVASASSD
jgi:phosphoribosylformimino-5-aminoimidazole carboxamide ribotide isomerase